MELYPKQWAKTKLGDVAQIEMGQSPSSRTYNDSGEGLPFFQGKAEFGKLYPTIRKWCSYPIKVAEAGDILLSVRAPVGPTNLAPERCCIGRGLAAIRAETSIEQKYLLHYFRYLEPWLMQQGTGSTFAAISGEFIRSIEIPLAPLNEQKRIADKLNSLLARVDACRAHLGRVPEIIRRFRQAVLTKAVSEKLTKSDHTNYGWKDVDIQSVAIVGTGSTPLRSNPQFYSESGTPWITSAATSEAFINKAQEFVTQKGITAHRLKLYPTGTLLVAMYGEGKTRGQVSELAIEATINQACAAIIVDETVAEKAYVKLALQANYLEMRELAEGGNQPNLNLSKIKKFRFLLPPRKEQQEIIRQIETLFGFADRLEIHYQTTAQIMSDLTPALLAKAFRGELVPQDPHDEPGIRAFGAHPTRTAPGGIRSPNGA